MKIFILSIILFSILSCSTDSQNDDNPFSNYSKNPGENAQELGREMTIREKIDSFLQNLFKKNKPEK